MENTDQVKSEFQDIVRSAVIDALNYIQIAISDDKYLGEIYNWVSISWYNNGMPSFSEASNDSPPDYLYAFRATSGKESPETPVAGNSASLDRLRQLVLGNDFLRERITPYWIKSEEDEHDFIGLTIEFIPKKLASRYVHVYNTTEFNDDFYQEIYRPYAASIFDEKLSLDVCVPILFLNFSFDEIRIGEQARIERMNDDFQLARYHIKAYGPGVHDSVLSCATHALVLENWKIENSNSSQLDEIFSNVDAFPVDHIDRFFCALRTVSIHPTGYCQLIANPIGWGKDWTAYLPPIASAKQIIIFYHIL